MNILKNTGMNTTDLQIIEIRQVNAQQVDNDKTMYNF